MSTISITPTDPTYDAFEKILRDRIAGNTEPLFTTDVPEEDLWAAYLGGIPEEARQVYTCHACRRFIQRYGGLVTIDENGNAAPFLWSAENVPEYFVGVIDNLDERVRWARVTGVFLWGERVWGQPRTGDWTHLHGIPRRTYGDRLKNAGQMVADRKEDFAILSRGLAEFPIDAVQQAVRVLDADALSRSEKTLGVATWLLDLQTRLKDKRGRERTNLIWRTVATAPVGYCHIRSTMISTLLEDIVAGLPFETISKRWAAKIHPLRYQRPQAPPKEGNIVQAEKVVAQLGIASSLRRRYARLEDVQQMLWAPRNVEPSTPPSGGVFDHLRQKQGVKEIELPATVMTWEKFAERVLPKALGIDALVPYSGSFYGLLTAADPEAPPILQWDGLEGFPRNPVSWYFYAGGSRADRWGLRSNAWVPVPAIFLSPHQWHQPEKFQHQSLHVFFALEGAQDRQHATLALFPEMLRAELREVRAVIEAHSKSRSTEEPENGNANGLALRKGHAGQTIHLRVRTEDGPARYTIDRWE